MSTTTTNYALTKPTPGGDAGAWDDMLNADLDSIDSELAKPRIIQSALAWGATTTVDCSLARVFTGTNSQISTIAFSNVPSSTYATRLLLVLTNGGAFAITWPASVVHLSGMPPTLKTSGVDILALVTRDGGTTWYLQPWYPRNPAPDVTTTASGGGSPANLKAVVIPAGLVPVDSSGVRIRAWGTGVNNANAKSVRVTVGGNLLTGQSLQASINAHWFMEVLVYRTGATLADVAMWAQNNGTAVQQVQVASGLTVPNWTTTGITVQFDSNPNTTAGDIVQEGYSVDRIGL